MCHFIPPQMSSQLVQRTGPAIFVASPYFLVAKPRLHESQFGLVVEERSEISIWEGPEASASPTQRKLSTARLGRSSTKNVPPASCSDPSSIRRSGHGKGPHPRIGFSDENGPVVWAPPARDSFRRDDCFEYGVEGGCHPPYEGNALHGFFFRSLDLDIGDQFVEARCPEAFVPRNPIPRFAQRCGFQAYGHAAPTSGA